MNHFIKFNKNNKKKMGMNFYVYTIGHIESGDFIIYKKNNTIFCEKIIQSK